MTAARWTDLAEWRGPTPNTGGAMSEYRGLVIHIADGYYEGTIDYQKNPDVQVSSHFVIGDGKMGSRDGQIAQVVETTRVAWTQKAGNGHWLSAEFAGFPPHPLTDAQLDACARLFARMHRDYGVPLKVAADPSDRGLAHHSLGAEHGVDWGHPDCPGPHIIAQQPEIVRRAILILNGGTAVTAPAPTAAEIENKVWHTAGSTGVSGESAGSTLKDARDTADRIEAKVDALGPSGGGTVDVAALAEALRPVVAEELAKLKLIVAP